MDQRPTPPVNKDQRPTSWLKITYRTLLIIIIVVIVWYIYNLIKYKYIYYHYDFDLKTANNISLFLGNFVAPFITLITALLLLDNLKEVRNNNKIVLENLNEFKQLNRETKVKAKREETLRQCQIYLIDLQIDLKNLNDLNIPVKSIMISNYLKEPLECSQITGNNLWYKLIQESLVNNHSILILFLNKLEAFSAYFLHGDLDLEFGKKLISENYIKQTKPFLAYIAYYRKDASSPFAESILQLYKSWGGEFKVTYTKL